MIKAKRIIEKCLIAICCCIVLYILVNLYFLLLHPVLCTTIFPAPDEETGSEFYLSKQYEKLEYSELFTDVVDSLEILKDGEVVDFYYRDNWMYNNPIHGNIPNPYVLDVRHDQQFYLKLQSNIIDFAEFYGCYGNYSIYIVPDNNLPESNAEDGKVVAIAFHKDKYELRCIMLPEEDELYINNRNGLSSLEW